MNQQNASNTRENCLKICALTRTRNRTQTWVLDWLMLCMTISHVSDLACTDESDGDSEWRFPAEFLFSCQVTLLTLSGTLRFEKFHYWILFIFLKIETAKLDALKIEKLYDEYKGDVEAEIICEQKWSWPKSLKIELLSNAKCQCRHDFLSGNKWFDSIFSKRCRWIIDLHWNPWSSKYIVQFGSRTAMKFQVLVVSVVPVTTFV